MDPIPNNKRKATDLTVHPPRAAPALNGPQFFSKNFASPGTMPKPGNALPLEYLNSPTPSRALEAPLPLTLEGLTQHPHTPSQAPASPIYTDVFDSMETQKGLHASMHAPDAQMHTPESPTLGPLGMTQTTAVDDEAFLKELATITESSVESAAAPRLHNLHFTPSPPEGFPPTYRGQAAEFMINLAQNTVIAWRAMAEPKFLVRFFDYDGKDGTARHQTLVLKLQKSLEIIASHVGTPATKLKISPPSSLALPDAAPPTTFLVYGASRLLRNTVVEQRIWSVPQVTFEAYPFESNVIPTLILCLAGFICPDDDTITNAVKTAWLQPLAITQLAEILLSADPRSFSGEKGAL